MGNYSCHEYSSLPNSWTTSLNIFAHPHSFCAFLLELCALLPYNYSHVCMFLVLDLCTYSTNKHNNKFLAIGTFLQHSRYVQGAPLYFALRHSRSHPLTPYPVTTVTNSRTTSPKAWHTCLDGRPTPNIQCQSNLTDVHDVRTALALKKNIQLECLPWHDSPTSPCSLCMYAALHRPIVSTWDLTQLGIENWKHLQTTYQCWNCSLAFDTLTLFHIQFKWSQQLHA